MTKLRSNLLTITLDALMMLYINGPSMEQVVELVAADKDPAIRAEVRGEASEGTSFMIV